MFFLLLIFGLSFLFFNIRAAFGNIIAASCIILTLVCFSLREYPAGFIGQAFFAVWICEALLFFIGWGIIRLIHLAIFKKKFDKKISRLGSRICFAVSLLATGVFVTVGMMHSENYKMREFTFEVKKELAEQPFTMAVFSDLHMSPLSAHEKLQRFVEDLKTIKPDYILFAGDLADIHSDDLTAQGYDKYFKEMAKIAPSFAINGNHEGYMEVNGSTPMHWLETQGWTSLEDKTICTENVCFTGRNDFQVSKKRDIPRKPLEDLRPTAEVPWVLLDHQPRGIETEYSGRLPDLAFSGHTHDGQFFPGTVIINWVWRLAYGFGNLDNVPWIVTSGIASWGPPVRVGSDTEFWLVKIKAKE